MPIVFKRRIPRHSKPLREMAAFLHKHNPVKSNIEVYVYDIPILTEELLDSYEDGDSCEHDDLFGVYMPDFGHILLAIGAINATLAQGILAHEYGHALQHITGSPFKEANADAHAIWALLNLQTHETYL